MSSSNESINSKNYIKKLFQSKNLRFILSYIEFLPNIMEVVRFELVITWLIKL